MNRLSPVRDLCIFLLKTNLAVLGGIGTLLTVLDLGGGELTRAVGVLKAPAVAILYAEGVTLLLLLPVVIQMSQDPRERNPSSLGYWVVVIVIVAHIGTYSFSVTHVGQFLDIRRSQVLSNKVEERLNGAVTDWIRDREEVPPHDSLSEFPEGRRFLEWVGSAHAPDTVDYARADSASYVFSIPGPDKEFGTLDDQSVRVHLVEEDEGGG